MERKRKKGRKEDRSAGNGSTWLNPSTWTAEAGL